jgi:hypothetical protein
MKETLIINLIAKDILIGLIYCTKIEIIDTATAYIYNKNELISSIEFKKIERTEKNIYNFYTKVY